MLAANPADRPVDRTVASRSSDLADYLEVVTLDYYLGVVAQPAFRVIARSGDGDGRRRNMGLTIINEMRVRGFRYMYG